MPAATPRSKDFLILVNIAFVDGKPVYKALLYFDGVPAPDVLRVQIGDRIGWYVQVGLNNNRQPLPYTLNFANGSFFGVSSLSVPRGGASPYLPVLALKGRTKYSLNVTGVGEIFDPEIQSGSDGDIQAGLKVISNWVITWDTDTNVLSYSKTGGTPPYDFPVPASVGDSVTFTAISNNAAPVFKITFPDGQNLQNNWASPFDPSIGNFPPGENGQDQAKAYSTSIGPYTVNDNVDSNHIFTFHGMLSGANTQSPDGTIKLT
jgi:hypothetical protein